MAKFSSTVYRMKSMIINSIFHQLTVPILDLIILFLNFFETKYQLKGLIIVVARFHTIFFYFFMNRIVDILAPIPTKIFSDLKN